MKQTDRVYIYIYNISVNINITRRVNYKKISRGYIRWWTCDGKISLFQSLSHPPSPPSSRSAREPCRGRGSPLENPVCAPFRFCPRSLCVPGHTIALNILCRAHFGGTFYRLRLKDGWLSRELTWCGVTRSIYRALSLFPPPPHSAFRTTRLLPRSIPLSSLSLHMHTDDGREREGGRECTRVHVTINWFEES